MGDRKNIALFVYDEFVEDGRGVEFSVADDVVAVGEIELNEQIGGVCLEIVGRDIEFVQVFGGEAGVGQVVGCAGRTARADGCAGGGPCVVGQTPPARAGVSNWTAGRCG